MRRVLFSLFVAVLFSLGMWAQDTKFVNLTPLPQEMTVGEGVFELPGNYIIGAVGLSDEIVDEAKNYIAEVKAATNCKGRIIRDKASKTATQVFTFGGKKVNLIMKLDKTIQEEGYNLTIKPTRIEVSASTSNGFFYAFQTIKKIAVPVDGVNKVSKKAIKRYHVPCVEIKDFPRFRYRGYMLDCSRHFFTVSEIKHILDGMAIYKMNRFHWHLTDDQGWRFEVKRYPKLTSVGSIASNCRWNDMKKGYYWLNCQYGPLFYTQDDCREIVAYAKKLHIEVVPEIDMPGHIMAALAAYPEFSCNPSDRHEVQTYQGGVWEDVLDVSNPYAVQFARDVLTEVMDVFPGEYVHIGGDECPTTAWEKSMKCQELQQKLKDKQSVKPDEKHAFRVLQSNFITQMAEHIKARGRKVALWNESVTAPGADLEMIKGTGAVIFCWNPCQYGAEVASKLGLDAVITEYGSGCYYINRKQSNAEGEPGAAGNGNPGDQLPATYSYKPIPEGVTDPALRSHYIGVQATFWTEHVCDIQYCDYLSYPRIIAIAETGWSPENKKDFESFRTRFTADTPMLDKAGRLYGRHYLK